LNTETSLTASAQQFIESVVALKPAIAVFDCDGTLWSGDSGADFFYWQLDHRMFPEDVAKRAVDRYADYKRGNVDETLMCGEMVTISNGIQESELEAAAAEFFAKVMEQRFFPEMLQLTHALQDAGCELWAVSSTNVWVVREGVKRFGIRPENVLGACVHIQDGVVTDRIYRVPSGSGKATALKDVVGKTVSACFGNSVHDLDMLEIAEKAFAVNPNPDLEKIALSKGWKVYWPMGTGKIG
jgi:HAD superfamily hydrolase (TIGR01490 family)